MEVWSKDIKFEEALLQLNKTAEQVPIRAENVTMLVFKPTGDKDHISVENLRATFLREQTSRRNEFFVLKKTSGESIEHIVILIANDRDCAAPYAQASPLTQN